MRNYASAAEAARRWRDLWSAGQGVGLVRAVEPVAALFADPEDCFRDAARRLDARADAARSLRPPAQRPCRWRPRRRRPARHGASPGPADDGAPDRKTFHNHGESLRTPPPVHRKTVFAKRDAGDEQGGPDLPPPVAPARVTGMDRYDLRPADGALAFSRPGARRKTPDEPGSAAPVSRRQERPGAGEVVSGSPRGSQHGGASGSRPPGPCGGASAFHGSQCHTGLCFLRRLVPPAGFLASSPNPVPAAGPLR